MVVEYMKHLVNGELVNPEWIVEGDFFPNTNDNTYIGTVVDKENRTYYVPDTLKVMDKVSIQERNLKMEYPEDTADNDALTAAHNEAQTWFDTYGGPI